MRRAETVFSLLLILLCAGYLYFVRQMDVGNFIEPGPGFMPAVVGIMALAASAAIFIGSIGRPAEKRAEKTPKEGVLRFLGSAAVVAALIPAFKVLGAIVSIFLLVLLLNKMLGEKGWLRPVLLAAACAVVSYVLFVLLLDVPLPKGIL